MAKRKIAVIAVHGIGPAQRYQIQDELASQFKNALEASSSGWNCDVFFPTLNQQPGAAQAFASALRIYQGSDKENPPHTVFDIYEGYWSPIDKNRTGAGSVVSWIFKSTFIPLSTNARLPATGKKLFFDLTYTLAAILTLVLAGAAALAAASLTYSWLTQSTDAKHAISFGELFGDIVRNPGALVSGFRPWTIWSMALGLLGGYALAQFIVSFVSLGARDAKPATKFAQDEQTRFSVWRVITRSVLAVIGALLLAAACVLPQEGRLPFWMHFVPLGFLASALFLRSYFALANDAFANRFGDIQIYTTRDNNSEFYGLREQIIETVQRTVTQVLSTVDDHAPKENGRFPPAYERIYVLGHSLGSTIALDVLIRLHELVEGDTLDEADWRRIRALVTFGTSLEKTKFFYDVQNPTLSQTYQQWRDDVDGHLFTRDKSILSKDTPQTGLDPLGIFWANYWYFHDLVANEIRTYQSSIQAGKTISNLTRLKEERIIAQNIELKGRFAANHPWVHSDYLTDPNFWSGTDINSEKQIGVLEVLTS